MLLNNKVKQYKIPTVIIHNPNKLGLTSTVVTAMFRPGTRIIKSSQIAKPFLLILY